MRPAPAPLLAILAGILSVGSPVFAQYGRYPSDPLAPYRPGVARGYQYSSNYGMSGTVAPYRGGYSAYVGQPYPTAPGDVYAPAGGYAAQPATPYPLVPPSNPGYPVAPGGVPYTGGQITALADQLVAQANDFLQAFIPKFGIVPESQWFMADGTALRDSAVRFRQLAASGAAPSVLAAEFHNAAANYQRLEARMARVNKGRIGPNIANALQMAGTLEQIRQLLP